jgi:hypothetical protein
MIFLFTADSSSGAGQDKLILLPFLKIQGDFLGVILPVIIRHELLVVVDNPDLLEDRSERPLIIATPGKTKNL